MKAHLRFLVPAATLWLSFAACSSTPEEPSSPPAQPVSEEPQEEEAPEVEPVESATSTERSATPLPARYAKIGAARKLSIPVIMIERPAPPKGRAFSTVDALMDDIV